MSPIASPPLRQAVSLYASRADFFGIKEDMVMLGAGKGTLQKGWLTFVTGLLLHSFRDPTNKVSLRTAVRKHLNLLPEGLSRDDLPMALRKRCEQANIFQVDV